MSMDKRAEFTAITNELFTDAQRERQKALLALNRTVLGIRQYFVDTGEAEFSSLVQERGGQRLIFDATCYGFRTTYDISDGDELHNEERASVYFTEEVHPHSKAKRVLVQMNRSVAGGSTAPVYDFLIERGTVKVRDYSQGDVDYVSAETDEIIDVSELVLGAFDQRVQ